jgi:hypothetical protein
MAVTLALLQAGDLVVTSTFARYGDEHLDHLGVPSRLRPLLPVVKGAADVAPAALCAALAAALV